MNTENLKKEYSNIFTKNKPEWAVKKKSNNNELVHPSIPFIGKEYNDTKILLYASAENLSYYINQNKEMKHLDNDVAAKDRHRYCFENCSDNRFFPHLHIEPVNNGALIVILAYLLKKLLNYNTFNSPYDLVEKVSIANFGKFSIEAEKNIDYVKDLRKLNYSIPFIKADIEFLNPDIIIIPETIFDYHPEIKNFIKNLAPNAKIIPIYQITSTTINTHIHKNFDIMNKDELPKWLVDWHEKIPEYAKSSKITGKTIKNYYSVYTYLDNLLKNINN